MFGLAKKHCFHVVAFLFLILAYFCGAVYPRVWPDEVLFFSPSFELYKYDILRTPVLEGLIPGMGTHTLWMPPTFMHFQSFLFHFLPADVETVRLAVSVLSILAVLLFSRVAKEMGLDTGRVLILQILLISDFLFFKVGHSARMEALCATFAFGSMYLLLYKKNSGKNVSRLRSTFAGVCMGFAFTSHPFAVAYGPVVLLILYFRKQFDKNIVWFLLGVLFPLGIWASYFLPNWEIFSIQFGAQLGRKKELLSVFTIINKFKIVFSEFKFPWIKMGVTTLATLGVLYKLSFTDWKKEFSIREFPIFPFSVFYTIIIFLFLFISSESWYVFHFVFPLALMVVSLSNDNEHFGEVPWMVQIGYNFFTIGFFLYLNFFSMNMDNLLTGYYRQIEAVIGNRKKIYLQAIPDPYFYLQKKHPELTILEFIPGELPFDPNYYSETMKSNEAFVFYDPKLMNPVLKEYFDKNSDKFQIEEIFIETPRYSDFHLKATVFLKKLP